MVHSHSMRGVPIDLKACCASDSLCSTGTRKLPLCSKVSSALSTRPPDAILKCHFAVDGDLRSAYFRSAINMAVVAAEIYHGTDTARSMDGQEQLSRREREIMDAVFARGEASANQVLESMVSPPTRTAVRTMLRNLVEKGRLTQRKVGRELFYEPTSPREEAGQSAIRRVLSTFFDGSLEQAISAHLADENADLDDDELKRLASLIRKTRQKGN